MRRPAILIIALLTAFAALPASAFAGTGGVSAPTGGSSMSGGSAGGSTGGTTVDPDFVPGGGGAPAGGADTSYEPPREPRGESDQRPVRAFARTDIPHLYLKLYRQAARRYGVDWRLLAALGKNESDHGRAVLPGVTEGLNFAGCCSGPMQICQVADCGEVWQAYRRDGDGDGDVSIYDPADSIHTAAALVRDLQLIVGRNPRLVMAAYNAGPGNVQRYRGIPPFDETVLYVRSGVRYMRALRG